MVLNAWPMALANAAEARVTIKRNVFVARAKSGPHVPSLGCPAPKSNSNSSRRATVLAVPRAAAARVVRTVPSANRVVLAAGAARAHSAAAVRAATYSMAGMGKVCP